MAFLDHHEVKKTQAGLFKFRTSEWAHSPLLTWIKIEIPAKVRLKETKALKGGTQMKAAGNKKLPLRKAALIMREIALVYGGGGKTS